MFDKRYGLRQYHIQACSRNFNRPRIVCFMQIIIYPDVLSPVEHCWKLISCIPDEKIQVNTRFGQGQKYCSESDVMTFALFQSC